MSWEINLWEKTCKLEPNLFRSSSICLSLSLESISSIDYLSNIPNISLWDWFNEATHIWPQPEETSEDERNMSNESWKDLYGKEISLRIAEFIQFCNILKKIFFTLFSFCSHSAIISNTNISWIFFCVTTLMKQIVLGHILYNVCISNWGGPFQ